METANSQWRHWRATASRWVVAMVSVASAVILGMVMEQYWHSTPFTSLFLCAIVFSAWFGGYKPGLLAVALSVLAFDYFFLLPGYSLVPNLNELPRLVLFAILALIVGWLSAAQRSTAESLRLARDNLAAKVQELKSANEALHAENVERKRAEAALRRSEGYLSEAQRLSHTGNFGWRVSAGELFWSEETFQIFQYDRAMKPSVELVLQRVHPEDRDLVKQTIERASQAGKDFDIEHRLLVEDGSVKHLHIVAHAERDASGELEFVGAVMDVTVAKEAGDKIRLIINTVPGLFWTARPDGWVDFLNQRWLDYTGMTLEQGLGWAWQPGYHPDDLGNVLSKWRAAVAEVKPLEVEARLRRFDGEYRWFLKRAFPLFDHAGHVLGWYGGNIDIHDLKQAEAALREQASLLNLTHDCIFVRDTNNLITYWNHGAEEFYGWTASETVGKVATHQLLQTVFPMPIDEINQELLRTGRWEGELMHTRADGIQVVVASRWSLRRDEHGRPVAILETNNDITERKRAEESLRQAQADLAHVSRVTTMGELTASIAHEVNQPLTAVVNNANACISLLPDGAPNLEEVRQALTEIIEDADRASDVITRVRQLAKKAPFEKSPLDLRDVVQDVLALALYESATRHITIRIDLSQDLPSVSGDRVQLQQVLLNLVINGMDAMSQVEEAKRVLTISGRRVTHDGTFEARLGVSDSGVGFKPEEMERLFEAFYTTKPQGMGMGLAISHSIIEAHGGRLWAEPNQGPGATFVFSLPVAGRVAS